MKRIFFSLLLIATSGALQAQTFAEWFNQKQTQKKYLLQQIAALQVYIDYAQKGYTIAHEGLTTIGNLRKGEFDLHGVYFNSLRMVNPKIKQYARVADIISLQVKIVQDCHKTKADLSASDAFTGSELDYVDRALGRLLDDCSHTLDELIAVTTDGKYEMKDAERMERIDMLFMHMQDNYTFCQSFSAGAKTLAAARTKEQNDIRTGRAMRGIQNQQP